MGTQLQNRYVENAKAKGVLIAEYHGETIGIGTREELLGLIADGVLPLGTVLRDARPGDFS